MIPKLNVQEIFSTSAHKRKAVPGQNPGIFASPENAIPGKINVFIYGNEFIQEYRDIDISKAIDIYEMHPEYFCWIDIRGLGTQQVLNQIKETFGINALVMEDIVNTYQRPKCEDYDDYLFVVSRMLALTPRLQLQNEQLSFICMQRLLITFQEDYDDILEPVRERLRQKNSKTMRRLGPSYLMYALMDVVIDYYFIITNRLSDELELIEDRLYQKPYKSLMYRIQGVKKIMLALRRAAWPERDKLFEMMRLECSLIQPEVKVFLRDAYDHSIHAVDLIESYRETSSSLMDLYLSLMSNKMNEVMKFLTIISAIFIPLTFIAGIYGMNFAYQDPETGKVMPHNMPELYAPNGYLICIVVMLVVAVLQVLYFVKKGWFRD